MAPSNFQAVNVTSTSVTFSWDVLDDLVTIQFYVITCTANGNITNVVSDQWSFLLVVI